MYFLNEPRLPRKANLSSAQKSCGRGRPRSTQRQTAFSASIEMRYPAHFTRFQWCICGKCQTQLYSNTASADFWSRCAAEDAPDRVNRRLRIRLYTL